MIFCFCIIISVYHDFVTCFKNVLYQVFVNFIACDSLCFFCFCFLITEELIVYNLQVTQSHSSRYTFKSNCGMLKPFFFFKNKIMKYMFCIVMRSMYGLPWIQNKATVRVGKWMFWMLPNLSYILIYGKQNQLTNLASVTQAERG